MAGTSVIRGSRIGAGPSGEAERGEAAARTTVQYWCANGHDTSPSFSSEGVVPELWDCRSCGSPAGQDADNPPPALRHEPYKTHLAYVKERRTEADGQALLDEALDTLRRRGVIP